MKIFSGLLFAFGLSLTACANLSTSIGGAYTSVKTLAQVAVAECGNTVPGGECRENSLLDRGDMDALQDELRQATAFIDLSNQIYNEGNTADAANALEQAHTITSSVRRSLELREVL